MKGFISRIENVYLRLVAVGVVAVVVASIVEFMLIAVACMIGVAVWIAHDFIGGIVAGFFAFIVGQCLALFVVEIWSLLPDLPSKE